MSFSPAPGHSGRTPNPQEDVLSTTKTRISKINTVTMVEECRYLSRSDSNGNPSRSSVSLSGRTAAVANRNGGVIAIHAMPELCDPMTNGVPDL